MLLFILDPPAFVLSTLPMQIDVTIPGMLATSIGQSHVKIDAETLAGAIRQLIAHRKLGPLIFDEAGQLRRHVLLFHNDTATRHLDTLDVPLREGDRLTVVQAVSGG